MPTLKSGEIRMVINRTNKYVDILSKGVCYMVEKADNGMGLGTIVLGVFLGLVLFAVIG